MVSAVDSSFGTGSHALPAAFQAALSSGLALAI